MRGAIRGAVEKTLSLLPVGLLLLKPDAPAFGLNALGGEFSRCDEVRGIAQSLRFNDERETKFIRAGKRHRLEIALIPTGSCTLLIIADRLRTSPPSCALLRSLYGLTPTEARVAASIVRGCTPQGAATELKMSIHTLRRHLKRVFAKMRVKRQSDMVRVITSGLGFLKFDVYTPNGSFSKQ